MIEIDGSQGGGAIVRVAVGLAAATQQPIRVTGIREKRPDPGLKQQHLAGIHAVEQLCDAEVVGNERGSTRLTFVPNHLRTFDRITIDIATAGSVGLALQPMKIAMLDWERSVKTVVDGGATVGKWAPPVPYLEQVALPVMERFGVQHSIDVRRHGFYPEGGALVHATFGGSKLDAVELLQRGDIVAVEGVSLASYHLKDDEVAERQRKVARRLVANEYPSVDFSIDTAYVPSRSPGSCIVLWAVTESGTRVGADIIGEKGKRAELVGQEAAQLLLEQLDAGAPVDEWCADQLIPVLALSGGRLRVPRFTSHVKHNIRVAKTIVDREWDIDKAEGVITVT